MHPYTNTCTLVQWTCTARRSCIIGTGDSSITAGFHRCAGYNHSRTCTVRKNLHENVAGLLISVWVKAKTCTRKINDAPVANYCAFPFLERGLLTSQISRDSRSLITFDPLEVELWNFGKMLLVVRTFGWKLSGGGFSSLKVYSSLGKVTCSWLLKSLGNSLLRQVWPMLYIM